MADLKTHLRELGVLYCFDLYRNGHSIGDITDDPKKFVDNCSTLLNSKLTNVDNITDLDRFSSTEKAILRNCFTLASKISDSLFKDKKLQLSMEWLGHKMDGLPYDIKIGNKYFSLKEESFILENMGLYKYLNLMTGKKFERGMHVFSYFSSTELNEWFNYSWNKLIDSGANWNFDNNRYQSKISTDNNFLYLTFDVNGNPKQSKLPKEKNLGITKFDKLTSSKTREKVFSKWIKESLSNDADYISIKKACAVKAGKELCKLVNSNINHKGIQRFLQIYPAEYYYAKSTKTTTKLYKVPRIDDFNNVMEIQEVTYDVPASQLNIITTITNKKTKSSLSFRNECRYSHGQLNGTPEAKMYYPKNTDLSQIYEEF